MRWLPLAVAATSGDDIFWWLRPEVSAASGRPSPLIALPPPDSERFVTRPLPQPLTELRSRLLSTRFTATPAYLFSAGLLGGLLSGCPPESTVEDMRGTETVQVGEADQADDSIGVDDDVAEDDVVEVDDDAAADAPALTEPLDEAMTPDQSDTPDGPTAATGAGGERVDISRDNRVAIELEGMNVAVAKDADGKITAISTESAPDFGDDQIELLTGLDRLTTVNLHNSVVTDDGLLKLEAVPTIRRLNLRRTSGIEGPGLAVLEKLPNLEILELLYNSSSVDNDALGYVAKLPKLRLLDLRGCLQVGDEGLQKLSTLKNLKDLKLRCTALTDEGVAVVGEMPKLEYLTIEDARVDGEGLASLADNSGLKAVTLFRTYVDDDVLQYLTDKPSLKLLNLRDTAVEGTGLEQLTASHDSLKVLNLSETIVSDDTLDYVLPFKNLEELHLWQNDVSDAGLAKLTELPRLKKLILKECRDVTNDGLAELAKIESLEMIDLSDTSIDDDGLAALKSLPNLRTLVVAATGVTREAAAELTDANDALDIQF